MKPLRMNGEHMQIALQFLTEAEEGEKKTKKTKHFLVRNNYSKTVENPWGTALCQWLKRLTVWLRLKLHTETRAKPSQGHYIKD